MGEEWYNQRKDRWKIRQKPEIGGDHEAIYSNRHELRGIGVGRECIAACLLYAFESMHADEVSAFVQKDDLAGLHTAVACRMQPTEKVSHTAFGKTAPCVRCVVRNPHLAEKAESENELSEDEKSTET